jgi:nucleoside-diphosphate-sugar epimerase
VKIVVIGGTGLIGSKVVSNLRKKGHELVAAVGYEPKDTTAYVQWYCFLSKVFKRL